LLVGIGIGAVAVGTKKAPRATTVTQSVAHNVQGPTKTKTVVRNVPGQTKTVTRTVQSATPTPAPSTSGSGGNYSGDGEKNVGTVNVSQDSTLHWTCSGDCSIFTINNDPGDANSISLSSAGSATSGNTSISAGAYHNVTVLTTGTWTFTISPG
jgi:hypothetical protein